MTGIRRVHAVANLCDPIFGHVFIINRANHMAVFLKDYQKFRKKQIVLLILCYFLLQPVQKALQKIVQLLPAVNYAVFFLKRRQIPVEQSQIFSGIRKENQPFAFYCIPHRILIHGAVLYFRGSDAGRPLRLGYFDGVERSFFTITSTWPSSLSVFSMRTSPPPRISIA